MNARFVARRFPVWLSAGVLIVLPASLSTADVELRGAQGKVPGEIESVTSAGVLVRLPVASTGTSSGNAAQRVLIGWDAVRPGIEFKASETDAGWTLADGTDLWRAVARVERGDLAGADPIFERLMDIIAPRGRQATTGPSQAAIAEGALRCRLARGSAAAAMFAYFEWIRTIQTGPVSIAGVWGGSFSVDAMSVNWIGGTIKAPSVIADVTGLVPELPPIFLGESGTIAAAESGLWGRFVQPEAGDNRREETSPPAENGLAELAGWYRAAMRFESALGLQVPRANTAGPSSHEGVRLVRDIVVARIGEVNERDAARAALRSRIERPRDGMPAWEEAWCRAAIGRSLVREADSAVKRQGVIELLHVPARFSRECPGLAGIALAEAAVVINELGDSYSAGVLVKQLRLRFPEHAAMSWEPVRRISTP